MFQKFKTALCLLKNNSSQIPFAIFRNISQCRISHIVSDRMYLKIMFKLALNKKLNISNPQTFNEKLQWLKLYDRKPLYTTIVDKYEVKEYIANIIGQEYIIPTLGIWYSVEEIELDKLPNQFVLKCTHDSGSIVICKDKSKLDFEATKKKLKKGLDRNLFWYGREWPYKDVKPRIIAEAYMEDFNAHELIDYKFMCFNGVVKCSFTCSERFTESGLKVTFFDKDWNVMPFERHYPASKNPPKKPINYSKMLRFSKELSKGIPFVRVDFYEINGKLYFGELTLYPGCGFEEFTPEEWDYKLGSWLKLPEKKFFED